SRRAPPGPAAPSARAGSGGLRGGPPVPFVHQDPTWLLMTILRRFLVLIALFFWQGGFTFYAAVVVPIGQQVLNSHLRQGFITQQVTNYLNLSGAIALVPLAWEVVVSGDPSRRRRWFRGLLWTLMALALAALAL